MKSKRFLIFGISSVTSLSLRNFSYVSTASLMVIRVSIISVAPEYLLQSLSSYGCKPSLSISWIIPNLAIHSTSWSKIGILVVILSFSCLPLIETPITHPLPNFPLVPFFALVIVLPSLLIKIICSPLTALGSVYFDIAIYVQKKCSKPFSNLEHFLEQNNFKICFSYVYAVMAYRT